MIRLGVTTARSLMNLVSIHLAVAVPLERVHLEAVHLFRNPVGTERIARVQRESCETNASTMTLPAASSSMMIRTCYECQISSRLRYPVTVVNKNKNDRSSKLPGSCSCLNNGVLPAAVKRGAHPGTIGDSTRPTYHRSIK